MLVEAGLYKDGKETADRDSWWPLQEPLAVVPEWQQKSCQPH